MTDSHSDAPTDDDQPGLSPPTVADVHAAHRIVRRELFRTPLVRSDPLSALLDADVYLKREDTLPTGAFKVRGGLTFAANFDGGDDATLVTASTGNHGQSVAYAGRTLGIDVTVVVPEDANESKVTAMERLGAEVLPRGADMDAAFTWAREHAADRGPDCRFVHPANEPDLIAGVGTAGLEVVQDLPEVDALFCPVGGGSSSAGYCLTVGNLADADVYGVQSTGADAAYRAYHEGGMDAIDSVDTFAEGVAVGIPFELPISILRDGLTDMLAVDDDDLRAAMRRLVTEDHLLVEGAAAAGLAGALQRRDDVAGKTVVLPISGRNVSAGVLGDALAADE